MLRNVLTALSIGLATLSAGHAQASVVNGDFETGDFTGWVVSGNGIAIDAVFPNIGTYDAVFTALTTDPNRGTLSQAITTVPGASYQLNFALLDEAGFSGDSLIVKFGGFTSTITGDHAAPPGNLASSQNGYTGISLTVPGSNITNLSTGLIFEGLNDPGFGIAWNLDDVNLVCTANCGAMSVTPAPPALLLFATGLLLWWPTMARIRRRAIRHQSVGQIGS
jgi:hypothetical protein